MENTVACEPCHPSLVAVQYGMAVLWASLLLGGLARVGPLLGMKRGLGSSLL